MKGTSLMYSSILSFGEERGVVIPRPAVKNYTDITQTRKNQLIYCAKSK
ncbi:MAG: hypothetical protein FD123_2593 [Bacteroidetes bacterium]|nr:MAG: hypothetical protein FD123_2593 [Bacteroidota bacterium]